MKEFFATIFNIPGAWLKNIARVLYPAILIFWMIPEQVGAQSITVTNVSPSPVCAGSVVTVSFRVTSGNGLLRRYSRTTSYQVYLSNSTGTGFMVAGTRFFINAAYGGNNSTTNLTESFTIPLGTTSGNGYKISIGSTNPTFNAAGGRGASPSFRIYSIPATPVISTSGSATFCAGGSVTLTSSVGNSYLWSTGAMTRSISPAVSGNYSVQVTNANACLSASSLATLVTVLAAPAAPTITAGGPVSFCAGGSVTLTSSAGTNYLWSTGATSASINSTTSGIYTVQIANANGCLSPPSVPVMVTVNPLPAMPVVSVTAQPTCTVGTGTITITAPTGSGFTYSTDGTTYSNTSGVFTGMAPGTYSLTAMNSNGCISPAAFVTVNPQPTAPVISQIPAANLIADYKFNGNANDATGNDNGTLQNGPAPTTDRFGITNAAYLFNGGNQYVSTANSYTNPSNFTISIWFKTNTTTGGRLIGFGNAQTGTSALYDRQLYINNAGQVYFGVFPGSVVTINSPLSYNDGKWHLATATLSAAGMVLYIDGAQVAADPAVTTSYNYSGYWKIGYDNLSNWPSVPSDFYFTGTLDDALIYSTALSAAQVATIYQSPDGAGNNGPVCVGSTLTFSATTLAGVTYAWTGPNGFTSSVQNPSVTYAAADTGVYSLSVTSSGGCTANAYTIVASASDPSQWTGNLSNNWNNEGNWCSGVVPDISTNVNIPSAETNMAVVTDNETCNNIVINTGASLTVQATGTLQIAGAITNNGTFDATSGTIEMIGTTPQTIAGDIFENSTLENLIISNNVTVSNTLNDTLNILGTLSFGSANATLNTGNNITLKSSDTATANVGILATGNTITGNVTVERYIATGTAGDTNHAKTWQLLAVPTDGGQTIKAAWQEGAALSDVASPLPGSQGNPHTGYGTMLTSDVANAATQPDPGFDVYTPSGPSIKIFNASGNNFISPSGTGDSIYNQKGYFVFVRGDRSVIDPFGAATPTILRSTGPLFTPSNPPPVTNVAAGAFESIGNPYASAIDVRNIAKAGGVNEYFYVWDPRLGSSTGYGAYQEFLQSGDANNDYWIYPGGGSYPVFPTVYNNIQSGQAFLVDAPAGNPAGTVSFDENAKVNGSALFTTPVTAPAVSNMLNTTINAINADGSTSLLDGALILFNDNYSNNVNQSDARKLPNSGENLAISDAGNLLAIEKRKMLTAQDTIFISLTNLEVANYRFHFLAVNPGQLLQGFLIDNYLNTRTPITMNGTTEFDFNVQNITGSFASNRFMIVFEPTENLPVAFTQVKAIQNGSNVNVVWKVENEMNIARYQLEKSVDGKVFNTLATINASSDSINSASYLVIDNQPLDGYNYYRIKSVDIDSQVVYSNIAKIQISNEFNSGIIIYPNPVSEGMIHLQIFNMPAGKYKVSLLNSLGQAILKTQFSYTGGTGTQSLKWAYRLSHGFYQLRVTKPDGSIQDLNVLY